MHYLYIVKLQIFSSLPAGPNCDNKQSMSCILQALNESLQNTNAPVRIVSGCIGEVKLTIPWAALIRDNCQVQISGLKLVITPQVFFNYTAATAG